MFTDVTGYQVERDAHVPSDLVAHGTYLGDVEIIYMPIFKHPIIDVFAPEIVRYAWYLHFANHDFIEVETDSREEAVQIATNVLNYFNDLSLSIPYNTVWMTQLINGVKTRAIRQMFTEQEDERYENGDDSTCCDGCGADYNMGELCMCNYM